MSLDSSSTRANFHFVAWAVPILLSRERKVEIVEPVRIVIFGNPLGNLSFHETV